ncbi:MAG: acyl-CoA thioesterase [Panacagrimonas sp.]
MNHLEISKAGLNWDVHEPFVRTITVIDEHQDEFGHTNNVSYLSMLQDVAWMHSQKLGLGMADYQRLGAGCVVRRHELNYLAPTHLGDRLAVATWVDENDFRLCMWRGYQIIREQDQALVMRARSQFVCIDMQSGKPRRMPPAFCAYQPARKKE